MINIIWSELIEYDAAHVFLDEQRMDRLTSNIKLESVRQEIYTSGLLIESVMSLGAQVSYNVDGKPCFLNSERQFNVTHSSGLVILGWSDACELGIDYEKANRHIVSSIFKKLCSEAEKQYYESLSEAEKTCFLLKLFTVKEAVSKLLGTGLRSDFSEYEIITPENVLAKDLLSIRRGEESYFVKSISFLEGYLSIATDSEKYLESIEINKFSR